MRTVSLLAAYVFCVAAVGAELGDVYTARDACPFEGCAYGQWTVKKTTVVYGEPASDSRRIGTLEPGSKVMTLTGDVHVVPGIAEIVGKPYGEAKSLDPRAKVYILDPVGEGRRRIFQNGSFYVTKIAASNSECEDSRDSRRCWVKVLKEPKVSWWVKIQMPSGTGWILIEGGNLQVFVG